MIATLLRMNPIFRSGISKPFFRRQVSIGCEGGWGRREILVSRDHCPCSAAPGRRERELKQGAEIWLLVVRARAKIAPASE